MANKFNKGDVVVLKSGGPPMTVDKVPGELRYEMGTAVYEGYKCDWFKGATAASGIYGEHQLDAFVLPAKKL